MPEDVDITVDTHEIDAMLKAMPVKVAKGKVRDALQLAGAVMLGPMKVLCPERTDEAAEDSGSNSLAPGVLRESLTTQVQVGRILPPRVKVGAPIETTQVAWLIENGFDNVKSKTHISGRHYMSSAFDESAEAAVDVLLVELGKLIESDDTGGVESAD
jgi:hypothetical protein